MAPGRSTFPSHHPTRHVIGATCAGAEGTRLARLDHVPITRASLPEPMYATLGHELPRGPGWVFEPKYDGMRVIAEASARRVHLVTRNGKEKSEQFPEVVLGLRELARRAGRTLLLDGEIVASGRRAGRAPAEGDFQQLQARMHRIP